MEKEEKKFCPDCKQIKNKFKDFYRNRVICIECAKAYQKGKDAYLESEDYLEKKNMSERELIEYAREYNKKHPMKFETLNTRKADLLITMI